MQAVPKAQLRFPDGGADQDNSEGPREWAPTGIGARNLHEGVAEQIDETQKTQRESDQEKYALGDKSDGDYPHDEQAAGS